MKFDMYKRNDYDYVLDRKVQIEKEAKSEITIHAK